MNSGQQLPLALEAGVALAACLACGRIGYDVLPLGGAGTSVRYASGAASSGAGPSGAGGSGGRYASGGAPARSGGASGRAESGGTELPGGHSGEGAGEAGFAARRATGGAGISMGGEGGVPSRGSAGDEEQGGRTVFSGGSAGTPAGAGSAGFGREEPDLEVIQATGVLACGGGSYEFPATSVGSRSVDTVVELHNAGVVDLEATEQPVLQIITADPSEFVVSSAPALPIAPGTSQSLTLEFSPHWTGERQATLLIWTNDPDESPCRLSLRGSGLPVGGPDNGAWSTTSSFATGRHCFGVAMSSGHLYLAGGCRETLLSTEARADVQVAPFASDGSLGSWSTTTPLPQGACRTTAFAYNGFLFVAGGNIDSDAHATDAVRAAPFSADGTVGAWSDTTPLPEAVRGAAAVVHGDIVYLVGGRTESGTADQVLLGRLGADGTVASWQIASTLHYRRMSHAVALVNRRLYALGGWDGSGVTASEFAPIQADGSLGAWTETTGLSRVRSATGGFGYGDAAYLLAGDNGETLGLHRNGVFAAAAADGTLGAWSTLSNEFATARNGASTVVYDRFMYVMGGWNQLLSNYDDVQFAPFE